MLASTVTSISGLPTAHPERGRISAPPSAIERLRSRRRPPDPSRPAAPSARLGR